MKRTVDEKLRYNNERGGRFATGYGLGVMLYRDYLKQDNDGKAIIKGIIDTNKSLAKEGNEMGKGFMCGIRDAANERKARQRK